MIKEQFESKTSCCGDIMCYPNLLSFGHQINIETFPWACNAALHKLCIYMNVEAIENRKIVNTLVTRGIVFFEDFAYMIKEC